MSDEMENRINSGTFNNDDMDKMNPDEFSRAINIEAANAGLEWNDAAYYNWTKEAMEKKQIYDTPDREVIDKTADKSIDDMAIPAGTFVQQPAALYGDKTINDMQIPPESSVTDEPEFSQD